MVCIAESAIFGWADVIVFKSGIYFSICQVCRLEIIHKRNEPNLARGQTVK